MKRTLVIGMAVLALGMSGFLPDTSYRTATAQSAAAEAASARMAIFTVENMTCALCPVTVKAAMEAVDGVKSVEIDIDAKTATVTFDASVASAEDISAASTNAGYPAAARNQGM